jgi:hypothetical protein
MYVYSRVRAMDGTEGGCRHLCRLRLGDLALAWSCVIAGEKMVAPEWLSVTSCVVWMDVERWVARLSAGVCGSRQRRRSSPHSTTVRRNFFLKKKTRLRICLPAALWTLHRYHFNSTQWQWAWEHSRGLSVCRAPHRDPSPASTITRAPRLDESSTAILLRPSICRLDRWAAESRRREGTTRYLEQE